MENGDLMEANRMKTLHPAYRVTDLDCRWASTLLSATRCSAASTSVTAPR